MFNKSENREDYQNTRGPLAAMARDLPDGFLIPWHKHRRAQLIYGVTGSITVSTEEGQWVVPPHRAVWIPGDTPHQMRTSGFVQMRTLYVEPEARDSLPGFCQVMLVTPLLRELIKEATAMPIDDVDSGRNQRILELILDELMPLALQPLHLPWPTDPRAVKACQLLTADLAEPIDMRKVGALSGASQRTLERLFPRETGLTCAEWRRQARLMRAIELLAAQVPVSDVATAVGYESLSAFSAVFRARVGASPSTYFLDPQQS